MLCHATVILLYIHSILQIHLVTHSNLLLLLLTATTPATNTLVLLAYIVYYYCTPVIYI